MSKQDLWSRFEKATATEASEPSPPPRELVAFIVNWERHIRNWKVGTLAGFAGISVSTIERVERGDEVSVVSLDRIANAFGYPAGRFTAPRLPDSNEDTVLRLIEQYSYLEIVPVRRLATHAAVRDLASCHSVLVNAPGVSEDDQVAVRNLIEWLDMASMVLCDSINDGKMVDGRRRELYSDIIQTAKDIERQGLNILTGVMAAPQPDFEGWKVAVVCVSTRASDPGAPKRKHVFVDRRNVSGTAGAYWD